MRDLHQHVVQPTAQKDCAGRVRQCAHVVARRAAGHHALSRKRRHSYGGGRLSSRVAALDMRCIAPGGSLLPERLAACEHRKHRQRRCHGTDAMVRGARREQNREIGEVVLGVRSMAGVRLPSYLLAAAPRRGAAPAAARGGLAGRRTVPCWRRSRPAWRPSKLSSAAGSASTRLSPTSSATWAPACFGRRATWRSSRSRPAGSGLSRSSAWAATLGSSCSAKLACRTARAST